MLATDVHCTTAICRYYHKHCECKWMLIQFRCSIWLKFTACQSAKSPHCVWVQNPAQDFPHQIGLSTNLGRPLLWPQILCMSTCVYVCKWCVLAHWVFVLQKWFALYESCSLLSLKRNQSFGLNSIWFQILRMAGRYHFPMCRMWTSSRSTRSVWRSRDGDSCTTHCCHNAAIGAHWQKGDWGRMPSSQRALTRTVPAVASHSALIPVSTFCFGLNHALGFWGVCS